MRHLFLFFFFLLSSSLFAQTWTFEERATMPEPVANNAVIEATVGDTTFVYSFGGIDQSKIYSGIHLRSFRYNTMTDEWQTIPSLPDTLGKIAAGASVVKNKIYIVGGYHVYASGNEKSSDRIHIFDPNTNTYEADGAAIPVAIDDHIQAVWRDSLIYVVTGWSDDGNVGDVQIYNPSTNEWLVGTSVPNSSNYQVFGGSGVIIGDTIFYTGGARYNSSFSAGSYFRKGYINPDDPTDITWESNISPLAIGYRQAATTYQNQAVWIGGSKTTYNFDGIAYNNSGGVSAESRVITYDATTGDLSEILNETPTVMDLRGIAKINDNQYIIAGGMIGNQQVSNKIFLLTRAISTNVAPVLAKYTTLYPNPANTRFSVEQTGNFDIYLYNPIGQLILQKNGVDVLDVNVEDLPKGMYYLRVKGEQETTSFSVLIQ